MKGPNVERNKPEKFPRPNLETDSTLEAWEDFEATWAQYKEEYNLSGKGLQNQPVEAYMWQAV